MTRDVPRGMPPPGWVCTSCGGSSVEVGDGMTQIDQRYAVGHCFVCTPWPKPKKHPFKKDEWIQPARKTVQLVRGDRFDRAAFEHQREVDAKRRMAKKLTDPKAMAKMSKAEIAEARDAVVWLQR